MKVVPVILAVVALAACGSKTETPGAGSSAITVEQALAAKTTKPLLVRGALIAAGGTTRLCFAILESYPPQCGGPSLAVEGLDLAKLGALTAANGVTWSDHEVVLRGTVTNGSLTVR